MLKTYKLQGLFLGFLLILPISGCNKLLKNAGAEAPPPAEEWAVMKISDGDTLKVGQTNGKEMKIRLCGIDADETAKQGKPAQSIYADQAKAYLEQLLVDESERQVAVTVVETDRYNRHVSEVWVNPGTDKEELVNGLLVLKGLARVYPQYVSKCPNAEALKRAEERAKSQKIGIWSGSSSIPPWEFRKKINQNRGS